ncbi:hypothetical protein VNO78_23423 [Psophocarpus tetragonolobus]|uniref:Uncharacterized protein n=1 Tax=Psophocarpus tetragonolobus TaxID=3891 RepID=A0AAN9S4V0_PSOTE
MLTSSSECTNAPFSANSWRGVSSLLSKEVHPDCQSQVQPPHPIKELWTQSLHVNGIEGDYQILLVNSQFYHAEDATLGTLSQ